MLRAGNLGPHCGIDGRKQRIALRRGMDVGDLQPVRHRHGGGEHVAAADHHDLLRAALFGVLPRGLDRRVQAGGRHRARRGPAGFAGQHDIGAVLERLADRLIGLAPHDDRLADGERAKMREVGFQPPRQLAVAADDVVFADRGDQHDLHQRAPSPAKLANALPLKRQIRHSSITVRANRPVEIDRRLVPVEHRPFETRPAFIDAPFRQPRHQRLADAFAAKRPAARKYPRDRCRGGRERSRN